MKLGVVITTYNRINLLKECLKACINQTYKFEKIIIVNNASTDNTSEYLEDLNKKNKDILIINSEKNLGGAGGFYLGLKKALKEDVDYILIIDDDAILNKDYNERIIKYIEKKEKNISGYSGTVKTNNEIQYEHRRHLKPGFKCIDSNKTEYAKEFFDYELSTFCGLFISKKLIEKIGLPEKDFFIWFDDTEYSIRLKKYGKIRNINKAELNHKTTLSKKSGYNWKSYYSIRNQLIIIRKYFSKITLFKFIVLFKIMIIGGKFKYMITKDDYYNYVSHIYIDAINDAKKNILGKNEKYSPDNIKIEKNVNKGER